MMLPVFSLQGMYNYDNTLFAGLVFDFPADRDALIDHILIEYGEMATIYTDPDFLKYAIGNWSKINAYGLQRLWTTTQLEYNPIWNKDGEVIEIRKPDLKYRTETGGETTTENRISADNASTYSPDSTTQIRPNTNTESTESGREETTRIERGNIGVTTTQAMIKEERDVANFSFYKAAAKLFADDFLILIY